MQETYVQVYDEADALKMLVWGIKKGKEKMEQKVHRKRENTTFPRKESSIYSPWIFDSDRLSVIRTLGYTYTRMKEQEHTHDCKA